MDPFLALEMVEDQTTFLEFVRVLIAGRIEVGALLDLIAAYLDAMEVHFTLFGAAGAPHAPTRDQVASANA